MYPTVFIQEKLPRGPVIEIPDKILIYIQKNLPKLKRILKDLHDKNLCFIIKIKAYSDIP